LVGKFEVIALVITKELTVGKKLHKIYCAGPLFNPKEKEEMEQIATVLENAGHSVFLPQRDGLGLSELFPFFLEKGVPAQRALNILNMAIFSLDVFEIIDSDGLVLNLNGRVPDEGAVVEAGIAWANNKSLVIFKNDDRSLIQGNCNPLVMGLSNFEFVETYENIPIAFAKKLNESTGNTFSALPKFEATTKNGKTIREYLSSPKTTDEITELLISLFGGIECRNMRS